jgi:predicted nucleic-acid-binding protein
MRALDTNILVRFLVNDDAVQGEKVRILFDKAETAGEAFYVATPVVLELLYVLDSVYGFARADILQALAALLLMPVLVFGNPDLLSQLVQRGRNEKTDLQELLVARSGEAAGCTTTLTFDRKAARSSLFELL